MSRMTQNMPALGNSRGVNYTAAEMSKDLQVYHLTSKHHPNQVYESISPNFVNSIEFQKNPSGQYCRNMKGLHMDQLDASLNQYKSKMGRMNTEAQEFSKAYKENLNGVVAYMEKQEQRRYQHLKNSVKKQEERQARFVDGDKERNRKIDQFIDKNQFSNLMARSSLMTQSSNYQINLPKQRYSVNPGHNEGDQNDRAPRGPDPNYMTQDRARNQSQSTHKLFRVHNPITNPIQYHIDNPYIINKMQRKYQSEHRQF